MSSQVVEDFWSMQGTEAHVVNEGPGPIGGFLQLVFLGLDLTPDFRLLI